MNDQRVSDGWDLSAFPRDLRGFWQMSLAVLGRRVNYGLNVFDREWDVLIVLDACRYDLFEEFAPEHPVYDRFDSVEPVYSCASATPEWIPKTFNQDHDDLVSRTHYVSGTGYSTKIEPGRVHAVDEVWGYAVDPESKVTRPEAVTNAAIRAYRESDAERFIFHYLPPHAPFLHCPGKYDSIGDGAGGTQTVWNGLQDGRFDADEVWEDYGRNLGPGLDEVETVLDNVSGKVVVTADHGNALGEWGIYGHPNYVPVPAIKRVPWAEATGAGRDEYEVKDDDEVATGLGEQDLDEHLRALGYKR
jgi:hypothetical protein